MMSLKENVVVIFVNFVMVSMIVEDKIDYYYNIFELDKIMVYLLLLFNIEGVVIWGYLFCVFLGMFSILNVWEV